MTIIFCIGCWRLFCVYHQNHEKPTDNPLIRIYVNKSEKRIAFKVESGYYLELSSPKTMKLLGGTESK